jgi:hypothetical protein
LYKIFECPVLPAIDYFLPIPVFTIVQAGMLLMDVWQDLPRMRARPIEPPQVATCDPEALWWEFVLDELQKDTAA